MKSIPSWRPSRPYASVPAGAAWLPFNDEDGPTPSLPLSIGGAVRVLVGDLRMISARRCVDIGVALGALIVTSPVMLAAAIGIKLTSAGPILYRAQRIARDRRRTNGATADGSTPNHQERRSPTYRGREFVMYKFRTMHVRASGSV